MAEHGMYPACLRLTSGVLIKYPHCFDFYFGRGGQVFSLLEPYSLGGWCCEAGRLCEPARRREQTGRAVARESVPRAVGDPAGARAEGGSTYMREAAQNGRGRAGVGTARKAGSGGRVGTLTTSRNRPKDTTSDETAMRSAASILPSGGCTSYLSSSRSRIACGTAARSRGGPQGIPVAGEAATGGEAARFGSSEVLHLVLGQKRLGPSPCGEAAGVG
mmetsp:Transcript_14425/g.47133  ORF Transcript_14425/g.47133 Transcript_14425/m.47133 type:complete len:218 (+) Transcript_14425:846-1499(+)